MGWNDRWVQPLPSIVGPGLAVGLLGLLDGGYRSGFRCWGGLGMQRKKVITSTCWAPKSRPAPMLSA